jgi:hypothetical protein
VITVLLPTPGVAAGSLDVAAWVWVDPDVRPRRRDDQGADALEFLGVANDGAVRVDVTPALANAAASDAGAVVGGVTQTSRTRRGDRIVKGLYRWRGGERQTGYFDLAFTIAGRRRAIPVSVAMA